MSWPPSLLALAAALAALVSGCAQWNLNPEEPSKLPPARMSADSVVLEIAFVRLPSTDAETDRAIWSEADEQHFPAELRRQLGLNGLRMGILGQQLPAQLREALDAAAGSALEERAEEVEATSAESSGGQRRLQCRTGRRAKVIVSKTFPTLAALTRDEGQIRGNDLRDAQCLLAIKPYPVGDGRVKLDITPEIEHGELKTQWVGQEGSLMQRVGRERLTLDRLRAEAILAPGQVLLVSATAEIKGLGEHFFAAAAGGRVERSLLLVRVAQTQWDDLFAPEQITAPLATPGE